MTQFGKFYKCVDPGLIAVSYAHSVARGFGIIMESDLYTILFTTVTYLYPTKPSFASPLCTQKVNPLTEEILRVDVKIQIAEIPRQVIMTKDNVNLMIDSVLYWHIIDPYQATFGISDVVKALTER